MHRLPRAAGQNGIAVCTVLSIATLGLDDFLKMFGGLTRTDRLLHAAASVVGALSGTGD